MTARILVLWGIMHNVRLIFCQILFVKGLLLIGISLASVIIAMLRRDYSRDSAAQKSQLKTHLTTIFSFLSGGIAGLMLFRGVGFNAMMAVGMLLVTIATVSIINVKVCIRRVRVNAHTER